MRGERITGVVASAMDARGVHAGTYKVRVKARHVVLAAGAIGSPAVLLKSGLPDPNKLVGKRTFLHPTVVSGAFMPDKVEGWSGAPQSIYSDHFLHTQPIDGRVGFKLEAPPLHPLLTATTLGGYGLMHADLMANMPNLHVLIALMRDGFHEQSQGGAVYLNGDGTPALDYPVNDYLWDGARRALLAMAEIQFAAGARRGMVGSDGRHHQVENLHVFDGSLFPTSLGVNPQLSIYGLTAKLASNLAVVLAKS